MTNFDHSLAIIIGIDAYSGGIPRLTTAVNDATRLAELLQDAHGYETLLLTEPAIGQPVTLERIRALFTEELSVRLGENDRLLVYFAGHGVALDGDDGPRGYLVPQDARPDDSASMLPMTDLHAWLTELPCRHMLAILDCCFAGAFRWSATRQIGALPDVIHKERYDRYLLSPAWQVLTSAAYDQKALDVLGGDVLGRREADHRKHSPFALALFDALEKGEADLIPKGKGDGVITATELYLFLREQVEVQAEVQANHEQTPGLWPLNKHRKGEFIFLAPGHPLNLPPAPDLTADANPYRGLKSYDQKHSQIFFGREDEITRLVDLVDQLPFVAVLGASGTGKSSLVKAGVLPRLQTARSPEAARCGGDVGYQSYHVLPPMRPGDQPVQSLAALLRVEPGEDAVSLAHGADALSQFVARWAVVHPGQRLVLTIDQFEEMVTLCRDDEHQYFLRLLAAAIQGQPDVFRLIITLRGDFEPLFADTTLFKDDKASDKAPKPQSANDGINSSFSYVVPPMSHDDLRQVIERPASAQVLYFDPPDLVDKLIDEVIQTPGALPLLSFTLSELYVKYVQSDRDDRSLTGADYGALGGVVGSLRHRATEEYGRLPDEAHRTAMQRAMLRMVSVEGSELARRRVSERELDYLENDLSKTVIDRLVDARLLVHDRDNLNGDGNPDPYVEPAHDALVLAWDNLLAWKKEAEEYLPLQRRLWQSAREWQDAPPDAKSGLLWDDDPRLPQVEETLWPTKGKQSGLAGRIRWGKQVLFPDTTAPSDTRWLNEAEFSFVQASVRERAKYWQRTVYIASAVIVVLFGLTVFANVQRQVANVQRDNAVKAEQTAEARRVEAERNAAVAQARELAVRSQTALDSDVSLALLMAVEAMTITQPYLSISEPVSATDTAPFARNVVEPEPTQRLHVAAADQALIDALARPVGRPMKGQAPDLYLSEDGKRLFGVNVYSHDLKTQLMKVYEWDMERPTDSYQEWPALSVGSLQELAFRPDGTMVLLDGYLGSASPVQTNCLSPDHSALEHYLEIRTKSKPFGDQLAVSPNGQWFLGTRRIEGQPTQLTDLCDANQPIWDLSADVVTARFSNDGRWLLLNLSSWVDGTGWVNSAELWQMGDSPQYVNTFAAAATDVDFEFSPDDPLPQEISQVIRYSGLLGQNPQLKRAHELLPQAMSQNISSAVFVPGDHWLVTSDPEHVRLWNMNQLAAWPKLLSGHTGQVTTADFSPGGNWLATGSTDVTVKLWNMLVPGFFSLSLGGFTDRIGGVSFSTDGKWLATGSGDTIALWQMDTVGSDPKPTNSWEITDQNSGGDIKSLAINHKDSLIALGLQNSTQLTDAPGVDSTSDPLNSLNHDLDWPSMAFSYDDQWLAGSPLGTDSTGYLWDFRDLTVAGGKPSYELPIIGKAAFSPDGRWLAGPTQDAAIGLWDMRDPSKDPRMIPIGDPVTSVAFSSDSRWLALITQLSTGEERVLKLLDMHNPQERLRTLPGSLEKGNEIRTLTFSRSGTWLATAGADNGVLLWDLDWQALIEEACYLAGRNLSWTEWQTHFPDQQRYHRTCPNWPGHLSVAQQWWDGGVKLAKADHVQDAALQFEESRAINPDVVASNGYGNQTADEIARVIAAEALSTEGYTLAMQDEPELEKVIELLSRAKELNPDADFADPQGYARYLVAKNFLAQAKKRVSGGDMQAALVRISEAFSTYGYTDLLRDDGLWSELCWELSLAGFAREVLDNCELAVDEMSNTPDLRGGRGLARSLTGNYAGAAEDFQRWLDGMPIMPPQNVGVVEEIISTLREGRNPFDAPSLEKIERIRLSSYGFR